MGFFSKIGDIAKGAINTFTGGLGSSALDVFNNAMIGQRNADEAFAQSQSAAAVSYDRQKQMYKNRYQWTMEDMRKAGLNPILAAGSGGFNVGSGGPVATAQAFKADMPMGYGGASAKNVAEIGKIKKETTEKEKNIEKIMQETKLIIQNVKESIQRTSLMDQDQKNRSLEYWNIAQDFHIKSHQIDKIIAEVKEIEQRTDLQHVEMEVAKQRKVEIQTIVRKLRKELERMELLLRELRQRKMPYHRDAGVVLAAFKEFMAALTGKNP